MRATIAAALVLLALSGCAVTSGPDEPPLPSEESTPTAPILVEEDDMEACSRVLGLSTETLEIVTGIVEDGSGATLDRDHVSEVADELRDFLDLTTARMDVYAAPFASIVLTLDDIFEGRAGGSMTLDTGAYRDSVLPLMSYCTDVVGYHA